MLILGAIYRLNGGKKVSKLWAHAQKMVFEAAMSRSNILSAYLKKTKKYL
jgi:hypothetical protein